MIVISDASPLIALAHIGQLELLRQLYSEVIVPEAVYAEVVFRRPGRPGASEVRQAEWIVVQQVTERGLAEALLGDLGPGESEAIALAAEYPGALLLIDERRARQTAARLGLEIIGILGVVTQAKRQGLVSAVRPLLDDLVHVGGFRISPALYRLVAEREGEF